MTPTMLLFLLTVGRRGDKEGASERGRGEEEVGANKGSSVNSTRRRAARFVKTDGEERKASRC